MLRFRFSVCMYEYLFRFNGYERAVEASGISHAYADPRGDVIDCLNLLGKWRLVGRQKRSQRIEKLRCLFFSMQILAADDSEH
jgi:hypothetical protein